MTKHSQVIRKHIYICPLKLIKTCSTPSQKQIKLNLPSGNKWCVVHKRQIARGRECRIRGKYTLKITFIWQLETMFFFTHRSNLDFDRHAYKNCLWYSLSKSTVARSQVHCKDTKARTHTHVQAHLFRVNLASLLRAHASASSFMTLKISNKKNIYKTCWLGYCCALL